MYLLFLCGKKTVLYIYDLPGILQLKIEYEEVLFPYFFNPGYPGFLFPENR